MTWEDRLKRIQEIREVEDLHERYTQALVFLLENCESHLRLLYYDQNPKADPLYRAYAVIQDMGIIPWPNPNARRDKQVMRQAWKDAKKLKELK